jgi:uncharacterized protein YdeI (YjbR/CyaY-like superfamily)
MGSNGKKKTTMAKIMRENRMRERRLDKQARKDARKAAGPAEPTEVDETYVPEELQGPLAADRSSSAAL